MDPGWVSNGGYLTSEQRSRSKACKISMSFHESFDLAWRAIRPIKDIRTGGVAATMHLPSCRILQIDPGNIVGAGVLSIGVIRVIRGYFPPNLLRGISNS